MAAAARESGIRIFFTEPPHDSCGCRNADLSA
jgi:hypothetical protein